MSLVLVLPILVPLAAAALALLAGRSIAAQRALAAIGAAGMLAAALVLFERVWRQGRQVVQLGDWPAPFGITLVADVFSAVMLAVAAIVALAVVVFAFATIDRRREQFGFYPLVMTLMMGVNGAFLTGDLFNLYVWFEVLLISSFVLLALGGEGAQMAGALRYFLLNLLSSILFLSAAGILYGKVYTLNLADLAAKADAALEPELLTSVALLLMAAFGLKAAVFPLFFWLPASYPTPPPVVSALFAGLLTKVGVYALIRVFTLLFVHDLGTTHTLLLWVAGLTMVVGVLGAVAQNGIRRILSFHIVSQIGYMVMGLGLFSKLALTGSVFYIVHHILVKTNLFLIGGVVHRLRGTGELAALGGFVKRPALASLFAIAALALAGIPPTSGFWAKLILIKAGFELGNWAISACALVVSLLTLLSMSKIWTEVFWKPLPAAEAEVPEAALSRGQTALLFAGPLFLIAFTLAITFAAEPFYEIAARAAAELGDREGYVRAVLGGGR